MSKEKLTTDEKMIPMIRNTKNPQEAVKTFVKLIKKDLAEGFGQISKSKNYDEMEQKGQLDAISNVSKHLEIRIGEIYQ